MTTRRPPLVLEVFLLLVVLVLLALPALLPRSGYAGWPSIGFATALLLRVRRERRWAVTALLTVVATPALSWSYHVPPQLGVVGALALSLSALFVATFLLPGQRVAPGQLVRIDGSRFVLVTLLGAVLNTLLPSAMALAQRPLSEAFYLTLSTVLAVYTAELVVLPLVIRTTDRPAAATHPAELWAQRLTLVVAFVLAFRIGSTTPSLAFLLLPAVGWAAVRATQRETHVQVFVVGVLAYVLTLAGLGPFTEASPERLGATLASAQVYLFVMALCYGNVPLALIVDRLFAMTRQATAAAGTIERLLDSAGGTLFIATDALGRITHYSSGAERTLGYAPEEVLGRSPAMFHTPEEIARQAEDMGVAADHTTVVLEMVRRGDRRDWEFIHQDGSARMTSLTLSPVPDADGSVVGYIATGEDVTDRLRIQEALVAALDREHASVLRLQEVDDVKQELVSNVSHELRTPITSIAGYTELLVDGSLGDLNESQTDAVRRIGRNTGRLGLLVEDLLILSRAESGSLELEHTGVDLGDVAVESLDMAGEVLRERDLDVRLERQDCPLRVLGDADALERVVTNLLGNAVKFTPDGGSVDLCVDRVGGPDGPQVRLRVTDTGMGVAAEDLPHLFTRFYRAAQVTEQAIQGTGLGLSIVHAIVTQHGGTVAAESVPGRGTTITALFPAYAA